VVRTVVKSIVSNLSSLIEVDYGNSSSLNQTLNCLILDKDKIGRDYDDCGLSLYLSIRVKDRQNLF